MLSIYALAFGSADNLQPKKKTFHELFGSTDTNANANDL